MTTYYFAFRMLTFFLAAFVLVCYGVSCGALWRWLSWRKKRIRIGNGLILFSIMCIQIHSLVAPRSIRIENYGILLALFVMAEAFVPLTLIVLRNLKSESRLRARAAIEDEDELP